MELLQSAPALVENPARPVSLAPRDNRSTGLNYRVATNLEQVTSAWRLVYLAYLRGGLIDPNFHRVHTAPQAIGSHAAVIAGCIGPLTVSTLTAFTDSALGLPLDRVYKTELDSLRDQGCKLMEVGLFADRRRNFSRTAEALFQLMRHTFYFGQEQGITNYAIGVHPHHARFYMRAFGFMPMGELKTYPAVKDRPVVLLQGSIAPALKLLPLAPALAYFVSNPIQAGAFDGRYAFTARDLSGSAIEGFLRDLSQTNNPPV